MLFIGNKKFNNLEDIYDYLESFLDDTLKGKENKILKIYNNERLILDTSKKDNPYFKIRDGVRVTLLNALLIKRMKSVTNNMEIQFSLKLKGVDRWYF